MKTIVVHEIKCSKCDGSGRVYDKMLALFTVGIAPVMDWLMQDGKKGISYSKCHKCSGTGMTIESRTYSVPEQGEKE